MERGLTFFLKYRNMKDYKKALGVITVFVAMLTLGGLGNITDKPRDRKTGRYIKSDGGKAK